jgi:Arc/MetJ-type ribon-helix-helix transcriptional regulator
MEFELLDGYLLDGVPSKSEVVRALLDEKPGAEGAAPFYEGLQRLGARTPDLALIALRLVLAGKRADDTTVAWLRDVVARARSGDIAAREEYRTIDRPAQ